MDNFYLFFQVRRKRGKRDDLYNGKKSHFCGKKSAKQCQTVPKSPIFPIYASFWDFSLRG